MRHLACAIALLLPMIAAPQETPKFEAIVVRPHDPKDVSNNGMISWRGLAFTATNLTKSHIPTCSPPSASRPG